MCHILCLCVYKTSLTCWETRSTLLGGKAQNTMEMHIFLENFKKACAIVKYSIAPAEVLMPLRREFTLRGFLHDFISLSRQFIWQMAMKQGPGGWGFVCIYFRWHGIAEAWFGHSGLLQWAVVLTYFLSSSPLSRSSKSSWDHPWKPYPPKFPFHCHHPLPNSFPACSPLSFRKGRIMGSISLGAEG